MAEWISSNLATIIIAAMLALIVFSICVKLYKDKRNGNSACGCSCGGSCSGCTGCPHSS